MQRIGRFQRGQIPNRAHSSTYSPETRPQTRPSKILDQISNTPQIFPFIRKRKKISPEINRMRVFAEIAQRSLSHDTRIRERRPRKPY